MAQDDYRSRITTAPGGVGSIQLGPQAYIDPRDQRYVHDAYQYFLNQQGGQTELPGGTPAAPVGQDPMAGDAQVAAQIAAQDRGAGITGASAVAAMTQPEAYNIPGTMPKTPVSGVWGPFDYLQPQTPTTVSDPFLASGAAGGARLPTAKDPTTMLPQLSSQQDPAWWESARDKFVNTGQDIGNFFTGLKDKGIDIGKMAGSAIMNMVAPGLSFVAQALPERDPRQTAMGELYNLDDIGRVAEGELMAGYNPVSGGALNMLTGGRYGDPTNYGLQRAYDKRINTIENTLKDKYNMSDAEIADVRAGSYTGDVDTNLLKTLTDLDEAKEKEKDRLDLFSGDIQDTGDAGLAELEAAKTRAGIQPTDPFLDIPDRRYAEDDLMDYDEHYDMIEPTTPTGITTTPTGITTTPTGPGTGRIWPDRTTSEMRTRPPDFVAGAQTFIDPDPAITHPKKPGQDVVTNADIVNLTGASPGAGRIIWPDRTTSETYPDYSNVTGIEGPPSEAGVPALEEALGIEPTAEKDMREQIAAAEAMETARRADEDRIKREIEAAAAREAEYRYGGTESRGPSPHHGDVAHGPGGRFSYSKGGIVDLLK